MFIKLTEVKDRNLSSCIVSVDAIAYVTEYYSRDSAAKSKIVVRNVPDTNSVIYAIEDPTEVRRCIEIQEIVAAAERDKKHPNTRRKSRGASQKPSS